MRKWQTSITELQDSLELRDSEIEDLENDELSAGEAGFIYGYEQESEEDWWADEDKLIKQAEEKMGEVA